MAVISTKQLFDEYFKTKDPETIRKTRAQVDRPEVYAYEIKVGKQLVDMNEDELFEMICSFSNKKSAVRDGIKIGGGSFRKYVSNFRLIFQFYSDNYEPIRNPFHSQRFKGIQAEALLSDCKERFTYKDVEEVISKLHTVYDDERADYYELVMLLFYNGFANAQEIANLKEGQINFKKKEVRLTGRTVRLSDRCFELLVSVHKMEIMDSTRGISLMLPWHDGYFKFVVRQNEAPDFQDKDLAYVGRKINWTLAAKISNVFEIDINYRKLYLLGFYDFMVKRYGEDRVREIVLIKKQREDEDCLGDAMRDYGVVSDNKGYLKRNLVQFV